MKPYVTEQEWSQAKDESDGMFNICSTGFTGSFMSTADTSANSHLRSPWINEYKVSRTLAGVQAYIDAGKTYPGALHRVVDDGQNTGVYMIIENLNTGNVEYKRLKTVEAELIQDPKMTLYEAQQDYYECCTRTENAAAHPENVRVNLFSNFYTEDDIPNYSCKVAYDYHDIKVLCSPIFDDEWEPGEQESYFYQKLLGDYIGLSWWHNNGPNLYWLDKDTYNRESFHSFEWAETNPTVSSTITYQQAKDEYFALFPWAKVNVEGPWRKNWKETREWLGHTYDKRVLTSMSVEAFSIFNTFEAAQVCAIQGPEQYPGKMFSVIDDPDSSRNGMYMVTCTITEDQYGYITRSNWGALRLTLENGEHFFN